MNNDILIVGVSTRSAAASCVRAGLRPICLDLFGDRDLQELAEVHVLRDLDDAGQQLDDLAKHFDASTPVIYTGGMENRPDLIARIESRWTLWGCSSDGVRAVRDPVRLVEALRDAGCPALHVTLNPPMDEGHWLRKPVRGGGGLGIVVWHESAFHSTSECYFQEYCAGQPMSALFAVSPHEPSCELLGVCRQLVGESFLHATRFGWCGAIGPIDLPTETASLLMQIAQAVCNRFALVGLFGIDFVLDGNGIPFVTEVNPRYTGSTEVLEYSTGRSLIDRHAKCFGVSLVRSGAHISVHSQRQRVVGKAILYAPRGLVAQTDDWQASTPIDELPEVADVPPHGQLIAAGMPVCTVFATGETASLCETALRESATRIDRLVSPWRQNASISG